MLYTVFADSTVFADLSSRLYPFGTVSLTYLPHAINKCPSAISCFWNHECARHISIGAFHARWRRAWTCLSVWTSGRSTLCNRLKLCSLITDTIVSSHPSESHWLEQAKEILLSRFSTATIPNTKLHKNISAQGACDGCTSQNMSFMVFLPTILCAKHSWESATDFHQQVNTKDIHGTHAFCLLRYYCRWLQIQICKYRYASSTELRSSRSNGSKVGYHSGLSSTLFACVLQFCRRPYTDNKSKLSSTCSCYWQSIAPVLNQGLHHYNRLQRSVACTIELHTAKLPMLQIIHTEPIHNRIVTAVLQMHHLPHRHYVRRTSRDEQTQMNRPTQWQWNSFSISRHKAGYHSKRAP